MLSRSTFRRGTLPWKCTVPVCKQDNINSSTPYSVPLEDVVTVDESKPKNKKHKEPAEQPENTTEINTQPIYQEKSLIEDSDSLPPHLLQLVKKLAPQTGAHRFFRIEREEDPLQTSPDEMDKGYKIPDLMQMVKTKHPESAEILGILVILCGTDEKMLQEVFDCDGIEVLQIALRSSNDVQRSNAAKIVGLMAAKPDMRRELSTSDVTTIICKNLNQTSNDDHILSCLGALRNLAMSRQVALEIIENNLIKRIIQFLDSKSDAIVEQAAGILTNMATNKDARPVLLQSGAVPALVQLLEFDNLQIIRTALAALTNIGSSDPSVIAHFSDASVLALCNLLKRTDIEEIQNNIATLMQYLARKLKNRALIRNAGGLTSLIQILSTRRGIHKVKLPLIASIRNLTDDTPVNKFTLRVEGGLQVLHDLLDDRRINTASENIAIVNTLYNLATEEPNRIAMLKNGTVQMLFDILVDLEQQTEVNLLSSAAQALTRLSDSTYVTEWIIQQDNINRLLQAVSAEPTEKYLQNYLMLLAHLSSGSSKMKLREIMVAQNMLPTIMRLAENSKSAIIARYCATLTGLLSTQQQTQTS